MNKKISIIGSGFSALAAACYLAQEGNTVTVYEKNNTIGGRARQLKKEGQCNTCRSNRILIGSKR